MKHSRKITTHLQLNEEPLRVILIGAGGNGSEFFDGLMRLHQAMVALGGTGLQVTVFDDDEVSESNCVRQRFWPTEVGMNKAVALVQRTNMFLGTAWRAVPARYDGQGTRCDLIVSAVDNLATRKLVAKSAEKLDAYNAAKTLWLDMGCDRDKGQVILGKLADTSLANDWPNVVAHFPEMMTQEDKHNRPSCSAADSLTRQDLMINQTVAGAAINLLWKTLRTGQADYNGVMIDLAEGFQQAIPFQPSQTG